MGLTLRVLSRRMSFKGHVTICLLLWQDVLHAKLDHKDGSAVLIASLSVQQDIASTVEAMHGHLGSSAAPLTQCGQRRGCVLLAATAFRTHLALPDSHIVLSSLAPLLLLEALVFPNTFFHHVGLPLHQLLSSSACLVAISC